jgi:hypothetical protein
VLQAEREEKIDFAANSHVAHAVAHKQICNELMAMGLYDLCPCSADDQVSAAREGNVLQVSAPVGPLVANSSFRGAGRQSLAALQSKGAAAFASLPRGSIGPGSIAGGSIAGTVVTALNAGRPGSGAKSQISGVSAKSRASATATASLGAMLAKDKLTQVRHTWGDVLLLHACIY